MKINIQLESEDFNAMQDVILSNVGYIPTKQHIQKVWDILPSEIKAIAISWDCSDSVFRDVMFEWCSENIEIINSLKNSAIENFTIPMEELTISVNCETSQTDKFENVLKLEIFEAFKNSKVSKNNIRKILKHITYFNKAVNSKFVIDYINKYENHKLLIKKMHYVYCNDPRQNLETFLNEVHRCLDIDYWNIRMKVPKFFMEGLRTNKFDIKITEFDNAVPKFLYDWYKLVEKSKK